MSVSEMYIFASTNIQLYNTGGCRYNSGKIFLWIRVFFGIHELASSGCPYPAYANDTWAPARDAPTIIKTTIN